MALRRRRNLSRGGTCESRKRRALRAYETARVCIAKALLMLSLHLTLNSTSSPFGVTTLRPITKRNRKSVEACPSRSSGIYRLKDAEANAVLCSRGPAAKAGQATWERKKKSLRRAYALGRTRPGDSQ